MFLGKYDWFTKFGMLVWHDVVLEIVYEVGNFLKNSGNEKWTLYIFIFIEYNILDYYYCRLV